MATNKTVEVLRSFVRDGSFPLDADTLFTSLSDAYAYIKSNSAAYPTQLIGVYDSTTRVSKLYKVDYSATGTGYDLAAIESGSSSGDSGSAAIDIKGYVDDISDLPSDPAAGDAYYVNAVEALYIALSDSTGNNITYKKMAIDINFNVPNVSEENDGLMSKEQYSTFTNKTGSAALYGNKTAESDSAEYFAIDGNENDNYHFATMQRLGAMFKRSDSLDPEMNIESDTDKTQASNTVIDPVFQINVFPRIYDYTTMRLKVDRYPNGENTSTTLFNGALSVLDPVESDDGHIYFTYSDDNNAATTFSSVIYIFTLTFDSLDGGTKTITAAQYKIAFYDTISIMAYDSSNKGYSLGTATADGNSFEFTIDPSAAEIQEKTIVKLSIAMPNSDYAIDSIIMEGNGEVADAFLKTDKTYSYTTSAGFQNSSIFKVTYHENS